MEETKQYCTFKVDNLFLGIEVHEVQEVIRSQKMTGVPLSTDEIAGLINLRGQIVTGIDLRPRMGLPLRSNEKQPMNVVVRTDEGIISLLVDEIGDVVTVGADTFENPPATLRGSVRQLITGVHKLKDSLLLILDCKAAIDISATKVAA